MRSQLAGMKEEIANYERILSETACFTTAQNAAQCTIGTSNDL
ncbi:MAG: hypothetical protein OXC80_05695 [Gammaproteobacteria bacterium]|nr:hypothetical protein [Gammaproteobacteria bacterium]